MSPRERKAGGNGPFVPLAEPAENLVAPSMPRRWNGYQVDAWPIEALRIPSRQLRRHGERQYAKLLPVVDRFGFLGPILVKPDGEVIDGVARVEVARRLGWKHLPGICVSHLADAEVRTLRFALNKIPELAEWNLDVAGIEFKELTGLELDFSFELSGFDTATIDQLIETSSA